MPRVLWGLLGSMPRSWKHRRHDSQALWFPALRASSSSFPVHLGWWGRGSPSSTRSNCWARSLGAGEPGCILSLCTMKHWLFLRACFKSSLLWELSVSVLHKGVECLSPLAPTWGITRSNFVTPRSWATLGLYCRYSGQHTAQGSCRQCLGLESMYYLRQLTLKSRLYS